MTEALSDFLNALSPESRARVEQESASRQEELAKQWRARVAETPDAGAASTGDDFLVPGMSRAAHEAEYVVSMSLEQLRNTEES